VALADTEALAHKIEHELPRLDHVINCAGVAMEGSPGCHGPGGPLQDDGGGRSGLPDRAERPAGPVGLGRRGRVDLAADGLGAQVAGEGQQEQLGHQIPPLGK
jgi:hypothetical protein